MRRLFRLSAAIALGTLSAVIFVSPPGARAAAGVAASSTHAAATNPLTLIGEGSDDLASEIPAWANDLFGSQGDLSLVYDVVGGLEGRADYINGIGDFVVSGVPWQSNELDQLPASDGGLISAPVEVSAVGFGVAWGPEYTLNRSCSPSDQSCKSSSKYTGTVDIPSTALTDIMWHTATPPATCACLADPSILNATASQIPQGTDTAPPTVSTPPGAEAAALLRSEPSETSYYMQEYLQAAAPAEFAKIPFFKPPITEYLQSETAGEFTQTQQGVQSEVNYITNEAGGAEAYSLEGIVTALPPSALTGAKYFLPPGLNFNGTPAPYEPAWAGIQNASGQWVTPTTATIDAAVDAGGAQPLYALTNRVPGKTPAYPLTYIDNLYVPAHGVSADKAEAIATIIRYGVTAGQDAMPPQNDGQLSPGLVQQALSAANQVIASNCTGSGEQVIVSDSIGRYAPSLRALDGKSVAQRESELASIGPMLHCVTASSAPSTTPSTAPGTVPSSSVPSSTAPAVSTSTATGSGGNGTGSGSGSGSTPSASSSPASPSSSTQPGSSSSTGSGSSSGASPGGPVTLLNLPLPLPWSGTRGYDRLVAMVLGGLAFLLLWRSRDSLGRVFRS